MVSVGARGVPIGLFATQKRLEIKAEAGGVVLEQQPLVPRSCSSSIVWTVMLASSEVCGRGDAVVGGSVAGVPSLTGARAKPAERR